MRGEHLSVAAVLSQPSGWREGVLGAHCYSADSARQMQDVVGIPFLQVPMERLDSGDPVCEVWHGSGQLVQGQRGAIHYRHDDRVLFGTIALPEPAHQGSSGKTPLQLATETAYRQVFALLDDLQFPYLYRFWNYMADINSHSFGLERYRQFNLGRHDAFLAHGREVIGQVPAACAIGSAQGPLCVGFLAGRMTPLSIENPRQISAFQYPEIYGPRSPTFARASLVRHGDVEVLFVSGTASIVGHANMHPSDVVAQARETMANIKAVIDEANRHASVPGFDLSTLDYKVYVRNPADLEPIRAELARCVGDKFRAVYLKADVCRPELLLEIEVTATHPMTATAAMSGQRN